MNHSERRIRIHVRASFLIYLFLLYLSDGLVLLLSVLFALSVHEIAHLIAGFFLHDSFEAIELTPFGGVITSRANESSLKGIRGAAIAASGPAANYLLISALSRFSFSAPFMTALQKSMICVNASMFLLNVLPVLPLDGGRIVFSLGYYLFPISSLITFLSLLGAFAGMLFIGFAVYGAAIWGKLNISLLLVGIYMIMCLKGERLALLVNNRHTVLSEKLGSRTKSGVARVYLTHTEELLINLLPYLCAKEAGVYMIKERGDIFIAGEEKLILAFLDNPHGTISDVIDGQK